MPRVSFDRVSPGPFLGRVRQMCPKIADRLVDGRHKSFSFALRHLFRQKVQQPVFQLTGLGVVLTDRPLEEPRHLVDIDGVSLNLFQKSLPLLNLETELDFLELLLFRLLGVTSFSLLEVGDPPEGALQKIEVPRAAGQRIGKRPPFPDRLRSNAEALGDLG